ncbi:hypothetical protein PV11_04505 [Exophiala sideris]|uniref:Uncharacterized protein n=1 Tax=Exophiala sideris TaxID=1016849 RepID=A0A0D1YHP8_9EURO|nr:hypothetical protein PV11_04505 [Exophiala sideris]
MMTPSWIGRDQTFNMVNKIKQSGVELTIALIPRQCSITDSDETYDRPQLVAIHIGIIVYGKKPIYMNKIKTLNETTNTANGPHFAFTDSETGETWFAFTLDVWNEDDLDARKALAHVTGEDLCDARMRRLEPKTGVVYRHAVDLTVLPEYEKKWKGRRLRLEVRQDERFGGNVPTDLKRHGETLPVPIVGVPLFVSSWRNEIPVL